MVSVRNVVKNIYKYQCCVFEMGWDWYAVEVKCELNIASPWVFGCFVCAGSLDWFFWRKLCVWLSVTPVTVTSPTSNASSLDQCQWMQVTDLNPGRIISCQPTFILTPLCVCVCGADEKGITVTLDRFDPGRDQPGSSDRVPSALLPGDVLVPCLFSTENDTSETVVQSEVELHHCFRVSYTPAALMSAYHCSDVILSSCFPLSWQPVLHITNTWPLC